MYIDWKYSKIKHYKDNLCCFLVLSLNNRNFHKNLIIIFIESALSVVYKLQMSYIYLFLRQKSEKREENFYFSTWLLRTYNPQHFATGFYSAGILWEQKRTICNQILPQRNFSWNTRNMSELNHFEFF